MYDFSGDELIVLASLFGENIIYGIDTLLFKDSSKDYKNEVKQIIKELQIKEIINIDYMRYAYLQNELYDMLDCICHPRYILKIDYLGSRIYYKKEKIVECILENGYYRCSLKDEIPMNYQPFNENYIIDSTTITKALSLFNDFDIDGAMDCVNNQWLLDVILGNDERIDMTFVSLKEELVEEKLRFGVKDHSIYQCINSYEGLIIQDGLDKINSILKTFEEGCYE